MQSILSFVKDIPVLLKTYISPQIFQDIYQLLVIKGKRITKSFPIEVHVTEHCNLNCAGCSHFSCLAGEEYLEPEQFEKDFKRLAELTDRFFVIKILGGEPLLHPRITEFFEIARKYFPTTAVQLTTNGILLTKMPEEFWRSCRKNNIVVSISQYPIRLPKKEIKRIAGEHKVRLVFNGSTDEHRMCKMPLDLTGSQDIAKSHRKCAISWGCCVTLREGRIYTCCVAAHIKFFNAFFKQNLVIGEKDYIDIYAIGGNGSYGGGGGAVTSIRNGKDAIIDFLEKPFPFCRYCKTSDTKFAQRWGISKKEITEWID